MVTTLRILVLTLALALAGCSPKAPDPSLVLYEQPSPELAAKAHAKENPKYIAVVNEGVSMEPLVYAGDWSVYDTSFPFGKLVSGDVLLYAPDWLPGRLVSHAAAAKSGEAWIVHGINNAHYEGGTNGNTHVYERHYWGKLIQVYTKRAKK